MLADARTPRCAEHAWTRGGDGWWRPRLYTIRFQRTSHCWRGQWSGLVCPSLVYRFLVCGLLVCALLVSLISRSCRAPLALLSLLSLLSLARTRLPLISRVLVSLSLGCSSSLYSLLSPLSSWCVHVDWLHVSSLVNWLLISFPCYMSPLMHVTSLLHCLLT